ncbi:discoidin domain-containing protein [Paenibacillus xylanexedens]|uniref:discoidin domain-containing protein n=1 Tax=Paenibacillus xylanexedens TaxID=528191 RepID=UPI00164281CA|nr:discoidin domain-containing protein [Paenibacillus xylanexedens]
MASRPKLGLKNQAKCIVMFILIISLVAMAYPYPVSGEASVNENTSAEYLPTIHVEIDANGFKHPGIGLTKDILENMRTQVLAKQEPWYSYFNRMTDSPTASRNVTSSNQSSADPTKPGSVDFNSQSFNSKFIADSLKAYTQAIMYYVTGEDVYRANAMGIIRIWSQMDPAKYSYFTDSHIHTGIPLNRMVTAAEILRYTSTTTQDLEWTDQDTADFSNNLIYPVIDTFQHHNGYFMNQHLYPLLGAMSGYIFTGNRDRYNEGVEWFTVNETAVDQGQNGSIKQLFRWVHTNIVTGEAVVPPRVQHVEMGRDQAHGAGDLTNVEILARLLEAQETKVDPVAGTVSTAENAVNAYEYLDQRILKAADYFAQFMLGHDTPWTPVAAHTDADGNPTIIYKELAEGYRGRIGGNVYGLYYYYKYAVGLDMEEKAPYYADMFKKRLPFYWESPDGGADYWMFIPEEAATEGATTLPKVSTNADWNEIEHRATSLDSHSEIKQEGETSFVEITATEEGSRFSVVSTSTPVKTIGLRIRTNGTAKLVINGWHDAPLILPDTKGQWKYVSYTMHNLRGLSDLTYFKIQGAGTVVDMDHIHLKAGEQLTPPVFNDSGTSLDLYTYVGSNAALQYDFTATDAGAGDSVTYQINHKPEGAAFDESTGAFSWKPEQVGTYSIVVEATDGTTITAKEVKVIVSADRSSAVAAVIAAYNPETSYVSASLTHYNSIYADVMDVIATASDDEFLQKLVELRAAVVGLQELTPQLQDGSMDYSHMLAAATFYNETLNLLDNYAGSFAFYGNAVNLTHTMDFGPDYKVTADAFSLQVRASFPERIGGTAFFGSNDNETWTRLTPGLTVVSEDMQTLEVSEGHRNTPFRFFKIQMIEPSSTMLELSEFRIFGERHETNNKLQSLSISSPQSVQNRVDAGNTVILTFESSEPIHDVQAVIQGHEAIVHSMDQLNWTASAVMDNLAPTGPIRFAIDYKTANGLSAGPAIFTTDQSSLYLVNQSKLLDVTRLATVTASDKQYGTGGLSKEQVGYLLFDGNTGTFGDLATGAGAYYTLDFGPDVSVTLNDIMLMPRASYPARMNGVVLQGSNDNNSWTNLIAAVTGTAEGKWTYIGGDKIIDHDAYRYLRIYNSAAWNGNLAEVELYGKYDIRSIDSKVVSPDGYTKGSYYQYMQEVERIRELFNNPASDRPALLEELYQVQEQLVSLSSLPAQKLTVTPSMVTASTPVYQNKGTKEQNGWRAVDSNVDTFTDTMDAVSWIDIDLGENQAESLSSFKFYPRNGKTSEITRVNGAILQGSNDGTHYTDLYTISGISSVQWHTASITNDTAFRYLRYYSPGGYANVAELELYSKPTDLTLLVMLLEQADTLQAEIYDETGFTAMLAAKSLATEIAEDADSTQTQIDSAANELLQAIQALVIQTETNEEG